MKEGWEYKTIGEVVSFSRGLTYKKSDEVDYSTKVVLRSTNINVDNNSLNIDELKYLNENIEVEEEKLIKKGSILICMSNGSKKHLGKVALIEHDYKYAFGGFMGLLTPVIKINSKYLYYTLTTPKYKEYIKSLSEGANINNLKIKDIQKYIIPIFPLDEQRRIVSYLDSSFKLIDEIKNKALKSLTEAKALFQSALAEAMEPKEGWEEKTLGEICFIARGGSPRPIKNFLTEDESGIPWIKIGDTEIGGKFINCTKEKIKKEGIKSSRFVRKGDFLLSNSMSFGRPYILKTDGCIHDGWLVLQNFKDTFIDDFLYYLLSCNYVQKQFDEYAYGSTVRNLKTDSVSRVSVNFPPLPTQKQIVSHLDSLSSNVRQMEEKYQKMVEECDALKQAMLRDVFE